MIIFLIDVDVTGEEWVITIVHPGHTGFKLSHQETYCVLSAGISKSCPTIQ